MVYNSIPEDIKPSAAAAKLHYDGAFDNDFSSFPECIFRKVGWQIEPFVAFVPI